MHEPPELYYEPREWSHCNVLLVAHATDNNSKENHQSWRLPGGIVWQKERCQDCAIRHLMEDHGISVMSPENCLHHLFTFPFANESVIGHNRERSAGVWGDFYECIFRGELSSLKTSKHAKLKSFSLAELKELIVANNDSTTTFHTDAAHALKLYFQRQADLRAKRRLLKAYSTADLEHYGLRNSGSGSFLSITSRSNNSQGDLKQSNIQEQTSKEQSTTAVSKKIVVLLDENDSQRQAAVDFTLKTDDGMSPKLLPQADLVLLGVSRAGKTPLSLYIAQMSGLKVANIPLVQELPPPAILVKTHHDDTTTDDDVEPPPVDPKKVFCLTMDAKQLQALRMTRFRREMKQHLKEHSRRPCLYASADYVERDLENARTLARTHGFTELNVTNRAMEETASLIVSKLKERFPDLHII